jgi:hypothetical protein
VEYLEKVAGVGALAWKVANKFANTAGIRSVKWISI